MPDPEQDSLAVQVARLDERTKALSDKIDYKFAEMDRRLDVLTSKLESQEARLRSEMRWYAGGLAALITVGFTALGLLLKLT